MKKKKKNPPPLPSLHPPFPLHYSFFFGDREVDSLWTAEWASKSKEGGTPHFRSHPSPFSSSSPKFDLNTYFLLQIWSLLCLWNFILYDSQINNSFILYDYLYFNIFFSHIININMFSFPSIKGEYWFGWFWVQTRIKPFSFYKRKIKPMSIKVWTHQSIWPL